MEARTPPGSRCLVSGSFECSPFLSHLWKLWGSREEHPDFPCPLALGFPMASDCQVQLVALDGSAPVQHYPPLPIYLELGAEGHGRVSREDAGLEPLTGSGQAAPRRRAAAFAGAIVSESDGAPL